MYEFLYAGGDEEDNFIVFKKRKITERSVGVDDVANLRVPIG